MQMAYQLASAATVTIGRLQQANLTAYFWISACNFSIPITHTAVAAVFSCVASRNKRRREAHENGLELPQQPAAATLFEHLRLVEPRGSDAREARTILPATDSAYSSSAPAYGVLSAGIQPSLRKCNCLSGLKPAGFRVEAGSKRRCTSLAWAGHWPTRPYGSQEQRLFLSGSGCALPGWAEGLARKAGSSMNRTIHI